MKKRKNKNYYIRKSVTLLSFTIISSGSVFPALTSYASTQDKNEGMTQTSTSLTDMQDVPGLKTGETSAPETSSSTIEKEQVSPTSQGETTSKSSTSASSETPKSEAKESQDSTTKSSSTTHILDTKEVQAPTDPADALKCGTFDATTSTYTVTAPVIARADWDSDIAAIGATVIQKVVFTQPTTTDAGGVSFNGMTTLTAIEGSSYLDTSNMATMKDMFNGCSKLTSLDVKDWNTSNVTNMYGVFYSCSSLTSLDVSQWDTSNVTDMGYMFGECHVLTSLDVSQWDTSNVTDMDNLFYNCCVLTSLDVSQWDTSNVTDMHALFYNCYVLTSLDVSQWDTSNVTNMGTLFYKCHALTSVDVSQWDTSNVTDMTAMFRECYVLTNLDLSTWDFSKVLDVHSMFYRCNSLSNLNLGNIRLSASVDTGTLFTGSTIGTNGGTLTLGPEANLRGRYGPGASTLPGYTGRWVSVGKGTPLHPEKNIVFQSITDLVNNYDGATQAGSFVQETVAPIVDVHDSKLSLDAAWSAKDNFDAGINSLGQAVDFSNITVSGYVDTSNAGQYPVSYSYLDPTTQLEVTSKATVTVQDTTAHAPVVHVKNTTINQGKYWTSKDNFVSATDSSGNAVDFKAINMSGSVNVNKAGTYTVTYHYTDPNTQLEASSKATITVIPKPLVETKNTTLKQGTKWSPEDNFVSAKDSEGKTIAFKEVTVSGKVDTDQLGTYTITYSYTDPTTQLKGTKQATVTVVDATAKAPELQVKNSIVGEETKWAAQDNFVSGTDSSGNAIDFKDVVVSGFVRLDIVKAYTVTYTYTDPTTHLSVSQKATITVQGKPLIETKQLTLAVGDQWSAQDSFKSAKDSSGKAVDFKDITVTGSVDTSKAGNTTITYAYTDPTTQLSTTATTTVTVVNAPEIKTKDTSLARGGSWSPEANFDSAKDSSGQALTFKNMTISGEVDTTTPGDYIVTYKYTDPKTTLSASAQAKVTITNTPVIKTSDTTLTQGAQWSAQDNFVSAKDSSNQEVDFKDVTVTGSVDTTKVGDYKVTYSYLDPATQLEGSNEATITVVSATANAPELQVKDSMLAKGMQWSAEDNFVSAKDSNDQALDFKDIKVTGTVDPTKEGVYKITYSYTDPTSRLSASVEASVTITNKPLIRTKSTTLAKDAQWSAQDNFTSAKDSEGKDVDFKAITVTGSVDTSKVGTYNVTYSYLDPTTQLEGSKQATIIVANTPLVQTKNSTLAKGAKWSAQDNFISAKDSEGKDVDFKAITVTGTVDTSKVGTYNVTYSYLDPTTQLEGSKQATVTVSNTPVITVKNTTIEKDHKWTPQENFVSAKDSKGAALSLSQVKVTGTVNTTKVGTYKVIYSYVDPNSHLTGTAQATVTVKNKPTPQPTVVYSFVYRLYNKNTGEHFYTQSAFERDSLVKGGWNNEGTGWSAPNTGTAVYRVYNPNAKGGDHYYTASKFEADSLVKTGWKWDNGAKPVFYSGGKTPVYVAFNPNATASGSHNYTSSAFEQQSLLKNGWKFGKVQFYGK